MALAIRQKTSLKGRLPSTLMLVFALVAQPLVGLNIPAAFAASVSVNPVSHEINAGQTKVSRIDASGYKDLILSFDYVAEKLEDFATDGDSLVYGWRVDGGVGTQLGVIKGATGNPGPSENSFATHSLPVEAAVNKLEIYFTNTGVTSGVNDRVEISNIAIDGDIVPAVSGSIDNTYFALNNDGFNVGFTAHNFQNVSAVTVELQKADGTPLVANTGKQTLFDLINGKASQEVSTPFNVPNAAADSSYWSYGDRATWIANDEPQKAVITVVENNNPTTAMLNTYTINESTPTATYASAICLYDFPSVAMWEVSWGRGFEDRNGGPLFTKQDNGGMVSLNGSPVPDYMSSPDWHWLYVTDKGADANETKEYTYGFADGTIRTVNISWSDVDGCQIPTIVWGMTLPDTAAPSVPTAKFYDNNGNQRPHTGWTQTKSFKFNLSTPAEDLVAGYQVEYWNDIEGSDYQGEDKAWTTNVGENGIYSDKFTQGEGSHYFSFRARDEAGNWSDYSAPFMIRYDGTNPATNIVAPGGVTDGTFTVSGDASDNMALNRVYVQLVNRENGQRYGGTTINLIGKGTNSPWSVDYNVTAQGLPDGMYAAHVTVVDMAGNSGSAGWTENFTVDSTAPEIESATLENVNDDNVTSVVMNEDGKLVLTITTDEDILDWKSQAFLMRTTADGGAITLSRARFTTVGDKTYKVELDLNEGVLANNYTEKMRIRFTLYDKLENTTSWTYLTFDENGEYDEGASVYRFAVDNTKPVVSAELSNTALIVGGSATVTVTANDSGSGVGYVQYKIMDQTGSTVAGWVEVENGEETSVSAMNGLAVGSYILRARAFDNVGNKKSGADVTFSVVSPATMTPPNPPAPAPQETVTPGSEVELDDDEENDGTGGVPVIVGNAATTPIAPIISGVDTPAENTPEANDETDNDEGDILGEQDNDSETPLEDTGEVLGFMDSKVLGLAWYAWLAIAAALVGGWLVLAAAIRRRRAEQE